MRASHEGICGIVLCLSATALGMFGLLASLGCAGGAISAVTPRTSRPFIALDPASADAGSNDLTVTITAKDFGFGAAPHNLNTVKWSDGAGSVELTSTFISMTQITAVVPAARLANPTQATITVEVWDDPLADAPLRVSPPAIFLVNPPGPSIRLSPTSAKAGSPDLPLTVTGSQVSFMNPGGHESNFVNWTVGKVSTYVPATFVSSSEVTAVIPAALLSTPGTANLTIELWDLMGDAPITTSPAATFTVTP